MKTDKSMKACRGCGNLFLPANRFREYCNGCCNQDHRYESYIIENARTIGIDLPDGGHAESTLFNIDVKSLLIGYSSGV